MPFLLCQKSGQRAEYRTEYTVLDNLKIFHCFNHWFFSSMRVFTVYQIAVFTNTEN